MNKEQFLKRLRELLTGIPETEAEEAMDYYRDYFADAGEENESRVIEELGSPEKVAENILRDLGYSDTVRNEKAAETYTYRQEEYGTDIGGRKREKKHLGAAWIITMIATCWLWGPLLIAFSAILFGLSIALFAIVLSIGVAALALIVCAVLLIGFGIVKLFIYPAGGILLLGAGLLMTGLSIFGVILTVAVFRLVPAAFRGIARLWHRITKRGGKTA